ncbi:MAG TPA: glycosyltransferase family A protein [Legionellaceae bacterium]|nr:glycosyltransferase family A protein [Legionellaceae bacterium]
MSDLIWPNHLCEPVIITFNRATALEQTLASFAVLKDTHIIVHVLDNCSTDDTAQVVARWQMNWPGLRYHRNAYNIGGNANILRALEMTSSLYSWIIGDDDLWHLQYIDEVIHVLKTKHADIIRLGWLVSEASAGTTMEADKLFRTESFFFASVSMISATIVRRSLMTTYLNWAYQNIAYSYPQLVPCILGMQKSSLMVYSLSQTLITHTPSQSPGYFLGDLEWYLGWFKTARFFKKTADQKAFIAEIPRYMIRPKKNYFLEWLWLLKVTLNAKAQGIPQWRYLVELLLIGVGWRSRLLGILMLYIVFPGFLARGLRRLYFRLKKKKWQELQYDHSRL